MPRVYEVFIILTSLNGIPFPIMFPWDRIAPYKKSFEPGIQSGEVHEQHELWVLYVGQDLLTLPD